MLLPRLKKKFLVHLKFVPGIWLEHRALQIAVSLVLGALVSFTCSPPPLAAKLWTFCGPSMVSSQLEALVIQLFNFLARRKNEFSGPETNPWQKDSGVLRFLFPSIVVFSNTAEGHNSCSTRCFSLPLLCSSAQRRVCWPLIVLLIAFKFLDFRSNQSTSSNTSMGSSVAQSAEEMKHKMIGKFKDTRPNFGKIFGKKGGQWAEKTIIICFENCNSFPRCWEGRNPTAFFFNMYTASNCSNGGWILAILRQDATEASRAFLHPWVVWLFVMVTTVHNNGGSQPFCQIWKNVEDNLGNHTGRLNDVLGNVYSFCVHPPKLKAFRTVVVPAMSEKTWKFE